MDMCLALAGMSQSMGGNLGIFDKINEPADNHEEQVEVGIGKAGDMLDDKTGDKYVDQVDKAQDYLKDQIGQPNSEPQA